MKLFQNLGKIEQSSRTMIPVDVAWITTFVLTSIEHPWSGKITHESLQYPYEARCLWINLPSYGYEYCIETDSYEWCQRALLYHGWHGFTIRWKRKKDDQA